MKVKIFQTVVNFESDLLKMEEEVNAWMEGRKVVSVNAYAQPRLPRYGEPLSVIVVVYEEE